MTNVSRAAFVLASLVMVLMLLAACGAATGTGPRKVPCTGSSCDTTTDTTPQGFCVYDVDCGIDERCIGGTCSTDVTDPTTTCATTQDCAAGMYCDTDNSRCVECLRDAHCDESLTCRADHTCGPATGCVSDTECGMLVCNTSSGNCVECVTVNDCGLNQACQNWRCADVQVTPPECASQAECDPQGKICDGTGTCVACTSSTQCGSGKVCSTGTCVPSQTNVRAPAAQELVVNEILADPAADTVGTAVVEGDANGDGVRDTYNDEFVEIVNTTGTTLDVTDCTLTIKTTLRHTFAASGNPLANLIPAGSGLVVFGGGAPAGSFGGSKVFTASTGSLTLANDGGSVTLTCDGQQIDMVTYPTGGNDQSWTRAVDGDVASTLVKHLVQVPGVAFSPGTCANGSSFSSCL